MPTPIPRERTLVLRMLLAGSAMLTVGAGCSGALHSPSPPVLVAPSSPVTTALPQDPPPPAPSPAALPRSARYDPIIAEHASRYGVEPALVKAMIHAESNFDRHAVSPRGARGLMQLMPRTARSYGAGDLHDPHENIRAGVAHLRRLIDRFGSLALAVAAYNAGPGAVRRHRGLPPFPETRRYVRRVLRLRANYRNALAAAGPIGSPAAAASW